MTKNNTLDCNLLWHNCLSFIRDNVETEAFQTWFEPVVPAGLKNNDTLVLQLPSHTYYQWLETHYVDLLRSAIRRELGSNGKLQYRVLMDPNARQNQSLELPSQNQGNLNNHIPISVYNPITLTHKEIPNPFVIPGIKKHKIDSNLNSVYNFDNFVEGDCNNDARGAGWAIAQKPIDSVFNPFFVYSKVGLGKTHLVQAIGLQTKANHPDKLVLYVNSDVFYQQFLECVKNGQPNDFIHFYQSVDVLIIDDIQFLATGNKVKTQEVLFHIFNHLHLKRKQIIFTSDKSPLEISGFDTRLLSRFKWGFIAELKEPDFETRVAIVQKKSESYGIAFPPEVADYIALRVTSNIRELEGAMIAITAQASLNKKEITVELAKTMVDKYVKNSAKEISIEYIQKVVCEHFDISIELMFSKNRKREVAQVRQMCMYFAKHFTKLPLATIGMMCGNKNHATVLHSCRTITNLYETDKTIKKEMLEIERKLKS